MTNHLVVTAMGLNRPGIVSKLARLASDCECNVTDSRMALFGKEFTLIMLLSGSWSAIAKIETSLASLSAELELMTVMKRTSKHETQHYSSRIEIIFNGLDKKGTIKRVTEFLAERDLDLAAVRSHADENIAGEPMQTLFITINIPEQVNLDTLNQSIHELANDMSLQCKINM